MELQTAYGKQIDLLVDKCFTDKFKNDEITLSVLLDKLNTNVERVDIYEDGGIMNVVVDLTEENKSILSEVISDMDAYNELVNLEFHSAKSASQTDLCSLINYVQEELDNEIIYDWESKTFNYRDND